MVLKMAAEVMGDVQRQLGRELEPKGRGAVLDFIKLHGQKLKPPTDLLLCAALYVRVVGVSEWGAIVDVLGRRV